jgi:DNA-binding GntR family transcriptional regulator
MDSEIELAEALGRAREGSQRRIREILQTSPRRAHVLLRASIRRGVMSADQPVEEHSLIMSMMMSRNSIRSALQMLGNEGLILRRQRLGTSVVGSIAELPLLEFLPIAGWSTSNTPIDSTAADPLLLEHLEQTEVLADRHVQGRLKLTTDRVIMQEDLVTRGGEPIGILVGYYPVGESTDRPDGKDYDARIDHLRRTAVSRIEATVEAINCDERTARVLGVAEGAAILVRETLVYDADGIPKMLAYGHYRGDRVALHAEDHAVPAMHHNDSVSAETTRAH